MLAKHPKILYLVHDLSDSTVHKRVAMLQDGGADVTIMGFHRNDTPPTSIHGAPAIALAKTYDGKFIHRILTTLRMVATISKYKSQFAEADVIIARTLEMLAIAVRGRSLTIPLPALSYECLDIHRLLLKQNIIGTALRGLEGFLSKRASLLITSSPAFVREYFDKYSHVTCPSYMIENKIYQPTPQTQPALRRDATTPWRIGWFGAIRCHKSLSILTSLVRQMNGRVEVIIRGKPSYDQFENFDKQTSGIQGLLFDGPYKNPDDLEKIYGDVHFTWAIDMFEEGLNSSWLLPNRIYEGGYYGSVPLVQSHVETGRHIKILKTGVQLFAPLEADLIKFFKNLTTDEYKVLQARAETVPANNWILTKDDAVHLVHTLTNLRKENNE